MQYTQDFYNTHIAKLRELLPQIVGTDLRIEYGRSDERPGGVYSYLRIRYMMTAGGMQFCLKTITGGTEGSGFYTPDIEELLRCAQKFMRIIHKPIAINNEALRKKLDEFQKEKPLEWWMYDPYEKLEALPIRGMMNSMREPKWMKDADTVVLPDPRI